MATDIETKQAEEQRTERTRSGACFRPHVDILESQDKLMLVADMPGVTSNSLDIHFEDGILNINGKVEPRYREGASYLLTEYGVGDFCRSFRLSEQVDASRIEAELADGVLKVHLPKAEQAKPRKIEVRAAK